MKLSRGTIIPLIVFAIVVGMVSATYFSNRRIASHVKVEYPTPTLPPPPPPPTVKIEVYKDGNCSTVLSEIDWGTFQPSQTKTYPCWIRNEGDVPVILSVQTTNWNPAEAEQYMALNWSSPDYLGELPTDSVVQIDLELTIFSNCTGITSFSFDIVITAEGQTKV